MMHDNELAKSMAAAYCGVGTAKEASDQLTRALTGGAIGAGAGTLALLASELARRHKTKTRFSITPLDLTLAAGLGAASGASLGAIQAPSRELLARQRLLYAAKHQGRYSPEAHIAARDSRKYPDQSQ